MDGSRGRGDKSLHREGVDCKKKKKKEGAAFIGLNGNILSIPMMKICCAVELVKQFENITPKSDLPK